MAQTDNRNDREPQALVNETARNASDSDGFVPNRSIRESGQGIGLFLALALLCGVCLFIARQMNLLTSSSDAVSEQINQEVAAAGQLYQIGIAMNRYVNACGAYPDHWLDRDAEGKPAHSWRVALLPYLDCEDLYKKIRLDEPWDSAWNRQFHEQIPEIYTPTFRARQLKKGFTTFQVITGAQAPFPENGPGPVPDDIKDAKTLTIEVAEGKPVCWMDPKGDLSFAKAIQPVGSEGGLLPTRTGGDVYLCSFFDATAHRLPLRLPQQYRTGLLTACGGESFALGDVIAAMDRRPDEPSRPNQEP